MALLVAPRVFRAPEGPAAREARRPHFVRRRASKPARALRSLRRPSHLWGLVCWRVAGYVGSLSGQAPPPPINFARNSPATCSNIEFASLELQRFWGALVRVVTNVVNPRRFSCGFLIRCYKRRQSEGFSLIMVVFWLGLTTFVTGVLVRRFELRWFDDICNVGCSLVARPGPAAAHGHRRLALSARWAACLKPLSPLLAGACVGLKPPSPLRVRNGRFWCSFRAQR